MVDKNWLLCAPLVLLLVGCSGPRVDEPRPRPTRHPVDEWAPSCGVLGVIRTHDEQQGRDGKGTRNLKRAAWGDVISPSESHADWRDLATSFYEDNGQIVASATIKNTSGEKGRYHLRVNYGKLEDDPRDYGVFGLFGVAKTIDAEQVTLDAGAEAASRYEAKVDELRAFYGEISHVRFWWVYDGKVD